MCQETTIERPGSEPMQQSVVTVSCMSQETPRSLESWVMLSEGPIRGSVVLMKSEQGFQHFLLMVFVAENSLCGQLFVDFSFP